MPDLSMYLMFKCSELDLKAPGTLENHWLKMFRVLLCLGPHLQCNFVLLSWGNNYWSGTIFKKCNLKNSKTFWVFFFKKAKRKYISDFGKLYYYEIQWSNGKKIQHVKTFSRRAEKKLQKIKNCIPWWCQFELNFMEF